MSGKKVFVFDFLKKLNIEEFIFYEISKENFFFSHKSVKKHFHFFSFKT